MKGQIIHSVAMLLYFIIIVINAMAINAQYVISNAYSDYLCTEGIVWCSQTFLLSPTNSSSSLSLSSLLLLPFFLNYSFSICFNHLSLDIHMYKYTYIHTGAQSTATNWISASKTNLIAVYLRNIHIL